jgi:hypothetical protein
MMRIMCKIEIVLEMMKINNDDDVPVVGNTQTSKSLAKRLVVESDKEEAG